MKRQLSRLAALFLILLVLFTTACERSSLQKKANNERTVRNVILIIPDGMGFPAVGLLRSFARYAPASTFADKGGISALEAAMTDGLTGIVFTEPSSVPVVDSAASGTQIASGKHALSEIIGGDIDGNPVESVLRHAKQCGKRTGLVSDTRITHATPASFAANVPSRYMEDDIAQQLIQRDTGPDVMLSAGLRFFLPQSFNDPESADHRRLVSRGVNPGTRSRRKDNLNLLSRAETEGEYHLVVNRNELKSATGPRVLGLFAGSAMPDGIVETRRQNDPDRTWPTLDEMTKKALELLDNDSNGFFLMVEAGQIDWAEHNNDAGQLLHEMLKLDRVIETVRQWVAGRDNTAVIILPDHETGGFAWTYSSAGLPLTPQNKSGSLFASQAFQPNNNYGDYRMLDALFAQKMTCQEIFYQFRGLSDPERTPEKLAELVADVTGVAISIEEAARILQTRSNPYFLSDDEDTDDEIVPDMGDDQAFYSTTTNMLCGLLARQTGPDWNITWATGTHSAAPVPLIVLAPEHIRQKFVPIMHTTDVGKVMIDMVN